MRNAYSAAGALLVAALGAAAQTLTLDDCIRLALSGQSAAGLARQQVEIARLGVVQARANFLPQASVGNGYTYNSPLARGGEFSYIALNAVREYSTLGNVGLDIDTSGRLRAIMARARADEDAAAANLGIAQRDLKRAVRGAYYRVLLARHLAEALRDSLAEARSFENRTRLLAEHGEAAQADVVKAGAEVAFLAQSLNAAELEARLANHDLASFWTTEVDRTLDLQDVLAQPAPPPQPAAAGTPFLRRPEFQLLDAQRRGFLADARRARADLLPQLSFIGQYGLDSFRYSVADRGYASFVHLNIPVFDWFRARSAARQAQIQAQQVETGRRISERTFSRDYQDSLSRVELLYQQIELTDAQVKLSEDNLRLARVRYEGGEGSALDVVSAQSQLTQARTNSFTARANYLYARADLEVTSGR